MAASYGCYCLVLTLCLIHLGQTLPVSPFAKRRETTPEVLNLERQLKTQAGEDKQVFGDDLAKIPPPAVDGLDDTLLGVQLDNNAPNVNERSHDVDDDVMDRRESLETLQAKLKELQDNVDWNFLLGMNE